VGSYTVVDALVRYDLARVGLAGSTWRHVNNLFDREYVPAASNTVASGALDVRLLPPRPSASNLSLGTVRRAFLFKLADMQDNQTQSDTTFTLNHLSFRVPGRTCCIRSL
jgi:hypothetical protein